MQYVKKQSTRFELTYHIDAARMAEDAQSDGIFPLITNVADLCELELLKIYKRRPTARRVLDLFEPVQRHTLKHGKRPAEVLITGLTRVQRRLLNLLNLPPKHYGH